MGAVKVMLSEKELSDRERHNSRLFVDLCENIHIHFREYRLLFSLPEYFEFIDIVSKSTEDVKSYLAQNPDYEEEKYKTTLMVAGGKARQMKFLENSPQPNKSEYFDNSLRIELQEEYVTDEIHIHYRDLRIAMNRMNFKDLAMGFSESLEKLEEFERENSYERVGHEDRVIDGWEQEESVSALDTEIMGSRDIKLEDIRSKWHDDLVEGWNPAPSAIDSIKKMINGGSRLSPVVLVKDDGFYYIVDGHHRVRASLELGLKSIKAVVLNGLSWEDTVLLREAEVKLKQFDKQSEYKYNVSGFYQNYISSSLNDYYRDNFHNLIKEPGVFYKLLKMTKSTLLSLPIGGRLRGALEGLSGSKRYWR